LRRSLLVQPEAGAPGREGTVRLSALDIQNHPFASRWRGFDPSEVETFLRLVADDYELLVRERDGLKEKLRTLEARIADLTANEHALRETLVTAQALSEDLKRTAVKESELMISEAEVKGEKILDAAHRRAAKLAEDIREMKALRSRLGAALRTTIETHLSLLESLTAEPAESDPVLEGKVAYLTRRTQAGEA
jgi:cell division initiation protein